MDEVARHLHGRKQKELRQLLQVMVVYRAQTLVPCHLSRADTTPAFLADHLPVIDLEGVLDEKCTGVVWPDVQCLGQEDEDL